MSFLQSVFDNHLAFCPTLDFGFDEQTASALAYHKHWQNMHYSVSLLEDSW